VRLPGRAAAQEAGTEPLAEVIEVPRWGPHLAADIGVHSYREAIIYDPDADAVEGLGAESDAQTPCGPYRSKAEHWRPQRWLRHAGELSDDDRRKIVEAARLESLERCQPSEVAAR
jgi:hypothetical protein